VIWVIVAIAVVLVLLATVFIARQRRSQQLREGFGPEYERVLAERGEQRAAEAELAERRERRDTFEIRELEPSVRADYLERWKWTQRRFVDEPTVAAGEADRLVTRSRCARCAGRPVPKTCVRRSSTSAPCSTSCCTPRTRVNAPRTEATSHPPRPRGDELMEHRDEALSTRDLSRYADP
jgi:hypothetical protein